MKNLLELRDEIDVIDKQIVALYQQRMQIAAEVAEYKIETGKKVFDKDREMEKLATLSALGDSAFNRHGIRELFEQTVQAFQTALQVADGEVRVRDHQQKAPVSADDGARHIRKAGF